MIANIERQFLNPADLTEVHFYFGKHRAARMIKHLRIQFVLVISILLIFFAYHLFGSIIPAVKQCRFNAQMFLPWLLAIALSVYAYFLWRNRAEAYRKFLEFSPGKDIKSQIPSVPGHATK